MELSLRGRRALVTGASRGTGEGIARVLAEEGATVWVQGFRADDAEDVAADIRVAGGEARAVAGDIRTDVGASTVVRTTGEIDILVNNYGLAKGGGWDSSTREWVELYEENVLSGVRLVRALTPGMRARGWGRVIFVGTIGSVRPRERMPHYYAAKATLANITLSLAKELAHTGITVNCVSPGIVATEEVLAGFVELAERKGLPTDRASIDRLIFDEFMPIPAGVVGDPVDVGHLIAFLASDRARYINAADLRIDGGAADCV
jgi:NAD(P)-dependent dehydrogenase (short-subunit alcohol dehydrogenase family)